MNSVPASMDTRSAASLRRLATEPEQDHHNPARGPLRPKFHSGQVLTDADLSAFIEWVQTKQRGVRLNWGPGVARGLEVRPHPEKADHVVVSSGYAIGPDGEDIIVPEDTPYDLTGAIAKALKDLPATDSGSGRHRLPVDITLSYDEEGVSPQVPLTRERSLPRSKVVFTRVEEGFRIDASPADLHSTAGETLAFRETVDIVSSFQQAFPTHSGMGDRIREWFLKQVEERPLEQLADLKQRIANASAKDLSSPALISELLFLLVQDRRVALRRQRDHRGDPRKAIGLARVMVDVSKTDERSFQVIGVDSGPPHRTGIGEKTPTTSLADVSLVSLVGISEDGISRELQALGSTLVALEMLKDLPTDLRELKTLLDWEPMARHGDGLKVTVYDFGNLGRRLVSCIAIPPRLTIETRPLKDTVFAGETVKFETKVWNTTNRPVEIRVERDGRAEPLMEGHRLSQGEGTVLEDVVETSADDGGERTYTVTAFNTIWGDLRDGLVRAEAKFAVLRPDPRLRVEKFATPNPPFYPGDEIAYEIAVVNLGDAAVVVSLRDEALNYEESDIRIQPHETCRRKVAYTIPEEFGNTIVNTLIVTGQTKDGRPVSGTATHALSIPLDSPLEWFFGFWRSLARWFFMLGREHRRQRWFGGSEPKGGGDDRPK